MILLHGMECFMTRTRFDWQDPFFLDGQLGEEERLLNTLDKDNTKSVEDGLIEPEQ